MYKLLTKCPSSTRRPCNFKRKNFRQNPHPSFHSTMAGISTSMVVPGSSSCFFFRQTSPLSFSSKPSLFSTRHFLSRSRFPKIFAFSSNDIKVGSSIVVDGAPWRVLEFLHVKPGKGAAFVRTKIRNYITGSTIDRTFRANISLDEADVSKVTKQYTYKDGSQFVFMDMSTFEEFHLMESDVGDKTKWLKEGMDCNLLFWNGKVIYFELPNSVKLTVVDADPGFRGDTVQGGSKPVTVETGAIVTVPLFISIGDKILVDTRTGQYMTRA